MENKKKVLVFEFISGGGLIQEQFPASLAREGLLMLQTLINELADLSLLEVIVLLDWRIKELSIPRNCQVIRVLNNQSIDQILSELIKQVDYVWPIAPEIDFELEKISLWVERENKRLLNSSSLAVSICSDKWKTFQLLQKNNIPTVNTFLLDSISLSSSDAWVIKAKDGAGCLNSFFLTELTAIDKITAITGDKSNYIIQPYIKGEIISLSCLFKEGRAWLLCCNKQLISINKEQFVLTACEVNCSIENPELYQHLIDQVAKAISGLWGYVGIDIVLPTSGQPFILEINSRLTSSYVGIFKATGINVAATIVPMVYNDPDINPTRNISSFVEV